MTSDSKTKPEAQDTVDAETPDDSENRELTKEELATLTGGNGSSNDPDIFSGSSQGPDWSDDG